MDIRPLIIVNPVRFQKASRDMPKCLKSAIAPSIFFIVVVVLGWGLIWGAMKEGEAGGRVYKRRPLKTPPLNYFCLCFFFLRSASLGSSNAVYLYVAHMWG